MSRNRSLRDLRSLEEELLQSSTRRNPSRLSELLHKDFEEFGRSGKRYSRDNILSEFAESKEAYEVPARDFDVRLLADGVALLTYVTAHKDESGALSQLTLRSSLWILSGEIWQLRFHQGTPVHESR